MNRNEREIKGAGALAICVERKEQINKSIRPGTSMENKKDRNNYTCVHAD